ncbi:hypothetical protein [Nocardiopsis changdeensis]|uniref:hypothetical protein n=1 Tax=Nocardiopsis changdeensis TaxID=2831969 RepID=UPI003F45BD45
MRVKSRMLIVAAMAAAFFGAAPALASDDAPAEPAAVATPAPTPGDGGHPGVPTDPPTEEGNAPVDPGAPAPVPSEVPQDDPWDPDTPSAVPAPPIAEDPNYTG